MRGPTGMRSLLGLAELGCWAAGALLIAMQLGSGLLAAYGHASALAAFDAARALNAQVASGQATSETRGLGYAEPDTSLWAPDRIRRYEEQRWLAVGTPEAVIRIPRLRLEVPVFTGASDLHMTIGAGRIRGSPPFGEPGNVAVSSHRDGYFRRLKDVRVGDVIVVHTLTRSFRYVVEEIRITDPADSTVLWPGSVPEVTLVTCYPFYYFGHAPQRFVVRAELREEAQ